MWSSRRQRGVGMLEALIALGLLGLLIVTQATAWTHAQKVDRRVAQDVEVGQLKATALQGLDCAKTIGALNLATDCAATFTYKTLTAGGKNVGLVRNDGTPLFPGGRQGDWSVVARCARTPTLKSLVLYVSKRPTPAKIANDALTDKPLDWAPLFPEGANFCEREIIPTVTSVLDVPAVRFQPIGARVFNDDGSVADKTKGSFAYFKNVYFLHNFRVGPIGQATVTCPAGFVALPPGLNWNQNIASVAYVSADYRTLLVRAGTKFAYSNGKAIDVPPAINNAAYTGDAKLAYPFIYPRCLRVE